METEVQCALDEAAVSAALSFAPAATACAATGAAIAATVAAVALTGPTR